MHISMAADRNFVLPLLVSLSSISYSHEPGECTATVLHTGIDQADRDSICAELADRMTVNFIPVDMSRLDSAHYSTFLTPATLFRLLLPSHLPEEVTRTLYVDADTVTINSLRELWEFDLGTSLVAAVRDCNTPWAAGPLGTDWRGLGMSPSADYFNAGLLLIPIDRWRSKGLAEASIALLKQHRARWGDQDALNAVLEGQWQELPRKWNLQTGDARGYGFGWALDPDEVAEALGAPSMVHYTERDKPWNPDSRHPLKDQWYAALDRTSRRTWRPVRRSVPARSLARIRRLAGELVAKPSVGDEYS
jgi:lipopolysaccharide biosynthesis glycosyltransferase